MVRITNCLSGAGPSDEGLAMRREITRFLKETAPSDEGLAVKLTGEDRSCSPE